MAAGERDYSRRRQKRSGPSLHRRNFAVRQTVLGVKGWKKTGPDTFGARGKEKSKAFSATRGETRRKSRAGGPGVRDKQFA